MKRKGTIRQGGRRETGEFGLREKYYHSKGAALLAEGEAAKAAGYLRRALAIEETPYVRFHLALALMQMGRPDKALTEIDRALVLAPSVAGYHQLRGRIREALGRGKEAAADSRRARQLDRNLSRLGAIDKALDKVRELFRDDTADLWALRPEGDRLAAAVDGYVSEGLKRRDALEAASCRLSCPAYCCHFSGETIRHGLSIGPWKLQAIRNLLRDGGLDEKRFLRRMVFRRRGYEARLFAPDQVVREGRKEYVYFPARKRTRLGEDLMRNLPKAADYGELLWINEKSRSCAFLVEGRCTIYDAGGDPALPACKEFLCFTGFVFAALRHLRITDEKDLQGRSLTDLNMIAVDALLSLAEGMDGDGEVTGLRQSVGKALRAAGQSTGERGLRLLSRYEDLRSRYEALIAARSLTIRERVLALLGR